MPATSIRDIIVKDDDLIAGTHGRGIWILDDITPLRQLADGSAKAFADGAADALLFKPQIAYRVRQNTNTDTPIPPDEAAGKNPPDGAIIDYALRADAAGPITLEILDAAGKVIRHYSSADNVQPPDPATAPVPLYWYRPPQRLATTAGMHRFTWDVHYQSVAGAAGGRGGLPIAAVPYDTVPAPTAPWAAPGQYSAKLTVAGKVYTQPLTLKMDPRVKTPALGLSQQFTLSKQLYDGIVAVQAALAELRTLKEQKGAALTGRTDLAEKIAALEGRPAGGGRGAAPDGPDTLNSIGGGLAQLMALLQGADVTPTTQLVAAVNERRGALARLEARWTALKAELAALR
jgi:hypothetical protein